MKRRLVATMSILFVAALPVSGQQLSAPDDEVMKARQALADQYAAAVATKDLKVIAAAVTTLYTDDAIIQSLCPESPRAFGRDAYAKRLEAALRSGFTGYSAKVKEAHRVSDTVAWSTGAYTVTINDKDGKPEQARGNWIDMLRREGTQWKVSFQAYARTPCAS
jgi:uncharacterized protein (TIGR02246 family)